MGVLTTVIVAQVVLRYGFNSSLDWGWEVPRLCFIATVFLAIPLGLKSKAHVGIDLLATWLTTTSTKVLQAVTTVCAIGLMLVVAIYAFTLTLELWDQLMPTLNLSVGIFYATLAFSAIHSVFHLLNGALFGEVNSETRPSE